MNCFDLLSIPKIYRKINHPQRLIKVVNLVLEAVNPQKGSFQLLIFQTSLVLNTVENFKDSSINTSQSFSYLYIL